MTNCKICGKPIDDYLVTTRYDSRTNQPIKYHRICWNKHTRDQLKKEYIAINKKLSGLLADWNDPYGAQTVELAIDVIGEMADEIDRLKKALYFYANPETYFAVMFLPDPPAGAIMEDFSDTHILGYKPGKLARQALKLEDE